MAFCVSMVPLSQELILSSPSPSPSLTSHASQCQAGGLRSSVSFSKIAFVSFNGLRRDSTRLVEYVHAADSNPPSKQRHHGFVVLASSNTALPSINELPLQSYINSLGRIQPLVEPQTQASVFAVFDKNKKIQYIGFSKDVRNSLRTLMGRRPELCYFCKLFNLPALDQQLMLAVRQQWISELGSSPPGNSDPTQRKLWEQPADAGSISERGKAAAAKSKAKTLQQMMVDRGLKEVMVFDPKLLEEGKCDIMPSEEQTDQELAQAAAAQAEAIAQRKHLVVQIPSGGTVEFDIFYDMKFKTNGGWLYDIVITKDDKETRHRVVCGRIYPEAVGMSEDDFVERIFAFLLHKKVPRHTEGLLETSTFPSNYFAVSEVSQRFDDLKDWFSSQLPDSYWRFNKIHSYGSQIDPAPPVGPEDIARIKTVA